MSLLLLLQDLGNQSFFYLMERAEMVFQAIHTLLAEVPLEPSILHNDIS